MTYSILLLRCELLELDLHALKGKKSSVELACLLAVVGASSVGVR